MLICARDVSSVNACFHSDDFANRHAIMPSHAIIILLRQLRTHGMLGSSFVITSFAKAWALVAMLSATADSLVPAAN